MVIYGEGMHFRVGLSECDNQTWKRHCLQPLIATPLLSTEHELQSNFQRQTCH